MTDFLWVLVSVVVLLMVAGAAELASRWWLRYRKQYYVFPPGLRLRLQTDREVFPQLEPVVRFDINRDGERGDEVPRRMHGVYRVLVAGGSQPEGYLLDQDSSWPGALQRLLQRPNSLQRLRTSRVHVGNIARSGVGSEALNLIFERVLPRYGRLQAIVLLVGASDVLRWLEEGAPPCAPPTVETSDIFRCHPEGPFGWKPQELASLELLRRVRRRWLRPVQVHERGGHWIAGARASRAAAQEIRTDLPDPTAMLEHFEVHFRRLLQRATSRADRVIVVRQPWFEKDYSPEEAAHMWHGGVGQVWNHAVTTYYSFDVLFQLMRLLDARAAVVANALHVEHIDLMPLLDRSLDTYYDCFHVTPAGARAVADAVAAEILCQPLASSRRVERRRTGRAGEPVGASNARTAGGTWAALTIHDS
jgi:lysophospholipase L1-like esterase